VTQGFKVWLGLQEAMALKGDVKGSYYQRLVAAAYHVAPEREELAVRGYHDLMAKMERQKEFLKHDYEFVPTTDNPYRTMKAMKLTPASSRQALMICTQVVAFMPPKAT